MMLCRLFILIVGLLPMVGPAEAGSPRQAWQGLATTENTCAGTYDYHPNGGMRAWYCHVRGLVSVDDLRTQAKLKIWASGPHSATGLDLTNQREFGHYNPEFVTWMTYNLLPAAIDPSLREATQASYDTYVAPLARIQWAVLLKLEQNPACSARERRGYEGFMRDGTGGHDGGYVERWFWFMNPKFCDMPPETEFFDDGFDGGWSGNVVKTATGFWLRRTIDGTADGFKASLLRLLETYDAEWLKMPPAP